MDFPFFAPRGAVGELRLTSVGAQSESGDYLEMNFTPLLVYESRVTSAFKPPVDCGPEFPSKIASPTPCARSITTPRGRVIHRYDRLPPLDASLYVLLGETLIAIKVNDTRLFQRDLSPFVDAFEPATPDDLARAVDASFREREYVRAHPEEFVEFTPFVPSRTPKGYTVMAVAFDNPRDIQHPYLIMRWEKESGEIRVYEFALPESFAPPGSCGPDHPERNLTVPCSLRMTTPKGRGVHTGAALSPAHVPMGNTMVVVNHPFEDDNTLAEFVDSFRPVRPSSIRQFACADRRDC